MVRSLPPPPAPTAPELRAFYVACGLSPELIERAIKARRGERVTCCSQELDLSNRVV